MAGEQVDDGVEGVDAGLGGGGGMGGPSVEHVPVADHGEAPTLALGGDGGHDGTVGERVGRQGSVDAVEDAGL